MAQRAEVSADADKGDAIAPNGSTAPGAPETATEQRAEFAAKLVNRFAVWSGVAGLVPVPVLDLVAIGGLQIQMLRRLSQIFGVPFSENRGKAMIASLAGSMIPATSGIGAASALKAVPVVGWIVAGYAMPVLSAGATFAIGRAFMQHFASGGTLLDFSPPDYREFIKAHKEMWESGASGSRSGPATVHPGFAAAAGATQAVAPDG
jgi:uncharacterized protein (DUF697 family)